MADEKDKGQKIPVGSQEVGSKPSQKGLSADDLSKVAGGASRDAASGLPTGK